MKISKIKTKIMDYTEVLFVKLVFIGVNTISYKWKNSLKYYAKLKETIVTQLNYLRFKNIDPCCEE